MTEAHQTYVSTRYGTRARSYVASAVHAGGKDLDQIEQAVTGQAGARVLDLGCGGGHVSYRVAPHVTEVIAADGSADMLDAVQKTATERGLENIATRQCIAEDLPFADDAFDIVLSRFSAHHWSDFEAGLREAKRVLRRGGSALFIDAMSPGKPLLDSHLQAIELLRDPTHVRNYTAVEWQAALIRAGFAVDRMETGTVWLEFPAWVERTRTPDLQVEAIRALQDDAPDEVRQHFDVAADGSFRLERLSLEATG